MVDYLPLGFGAFFSRHPQVLHIRDHLPSLKAANAKTSYTLSIRHVSVRVKSPSKDFSAPRFSLADADGRAYNAAQTAGGAAHIPHKGRKHS
jgi:hypothetical protein